jgi:NADH:ubiquinone oxidoreductase subunit 4 (subunit M)
LPEAHVESPTGGSILLAGVLLKLGAYGFLRFSLPLFPFGAQYFQPFIATLSVLGILYAGLTALRQVDIKKIIAYSSVAHMGLCVLGIFSNNLVALEGAIHMLIAHGLVSGALFFCVGSLYSRSHTRLVQYYRGLTQVMPLFSTAFFFFTLANIAFPGSANFIAEFLLFAGILEQNPFITVLASLSILISAAYSL